MHYVVDPQLTERYFTVLVVEGQFLPDEHIQACLEHAKELDQIVVNLRRVVTRITMALSGTDEFGNVYECTREQAIEQLTSWAREATDLGFEDRITRA